MIKFPALLLLLAAIVSIVPTSCASNLLRKVFLNDGDVPAPSQPSVRDSPATGEMASVSLDSALSLQLDTSIQGFQQPNPKESLLVSTTSLTGYLVLVAYDDAACTKLLVGVALILNTCTVASKSKGGYEKLTATATDSFTTYYSDKECTMVTETEEPETYSSGCTASTMTYVSANGALTSSSAIVAISRCVVVSIIFSCHFHQSSSSSFLRLLIKLRLESY